MTECSTLLFSVLAGEHGRWSCRPVSPLSTVAFVGTWGARDLWTGFVWGTIPESRLLLPVEQPALDSH